MTPEVLTAVVSPKASTSTIETIPFRTFSAYVTS
jgi:hypothetical protein